MKVTFQPRSLTVRGISHKYALYVPPRRDERRRLPVILFLHGAGERGSDGRSQTTVGIGPALVKRAVPLDAIVVFPQCPRDDHWTLTPRFMAMAALDATIAEFDGDAGRVSLTGISMGAAGAWLVASENPKRFSALAPICGWFTGQLSNELRDLPTWIFHGSDDRIVPVSASRATATALRRLGSDAKYTEFTGVAHNSWDRAYQETELLDWLVSR